MSLATTQITSTRNGILPIVGFRQDLVAGDVLVFSLTDSVGVTSVQWDLLGRPEGSAAGGVAVPSVLGVGATASFTVDADALPFRLDGSYKVRATINPGAPSETRKTVVVARPTNLASYGTAGAALLLRRLAGFESLEDTSVPNVIQGWANQINRWFDRLGYLAIVSKTTTYAVLDQDDVILADATAGAFPVTLPTAVGRTGRRFIVKRMNAGGNAVTIASAGGTIDGAATVVLGTQYFVRTLASNGTNWVVIGS